MTDVFFVIQNDNVFNTISNFISFNKSDISISARINSVAEIGEVCSFFIPDIAVIDHSTDYTKTVEIIKAFKDISDKIITVVLIPISDSSFMDSLSSQGADYFFQKPFKIGEFINVLSSVNKFSPNNDSEDRLLLTKPLHDITEVLVSMGFVSNHKGTAYIAEAVRIVSASNTQKSAIELYTTISSRYATTPAAVERSIRTAIEKTWTEGNLDKLEEMFGFTVSEEKGKPSNLQFIYRISEAMISAKIKEKSKGK
ncbi:MAG: hypothetical protein E7315_01695 [Clostridiales bacterium]|nr:hypothetical protein [Clostridiales bacterium]